MASTTSRPDLRDDYRVMRWKDWYESKGLSKWAANRLRKSGKGPRVVQLTEHAVGVTVKDDREWTEARIRAGV
jgi:predicted DNA-binding transcriptional regulator AlpA